MFRPDTKRTKIEMFGDSKFLVFLGSVRPVDGKPISISILESCLVAPDVSVKKEPVKKFAIVILTDEIKIRHFEYEDDFKTARQTLATKGTKFIPLKYHNGVNNWLAPEVSEW